MPDADTAAPWSATRALITAAIPDPGTQIPLAHLLTTKNTLFSAARAVLLPGLADAQADLACRTTAELSPSVARRLSGLGRRPEPP